MVKGSEELQQLGLNHTALWPPGSNIPYIFCPSLSSVNSDTITPLQGLLWALNEVNNVKYLVQH